MGPYDDYIFQQQLDYLESLPDSNTSNKRMDYLPTALNLLPQIAPAQSMMDLDKQATKGLKRQVAKIPDNWGFGIGNMITTAGNVLNTTANDRIAMNASDNAVLGNAVSGNNIYDLFNNDKFYQGLENVRNNRIDYSNVKNNYNLYNAWNPNNFQDNIHYAQNGGHQYAFGDDMNHVGSILGSTAELAGIGTMIAPGIGTVVGAGLGAAMGVVNDIKNRRNRELLNNEIDRQNALQTENYYDTASLNDQRQLRNNMYNIFQQGGYIPNDNNITEFNTGGTHQQNPYGGIQQGIANDGKPNYVEEDEVRYKDYIFTARNKPSKTLLEKYNLPKKYVDKTFAEVADKLQSESKDRPNDPISKTTLDEMMGRLANAQEEYNAKKEERQLARMFDSLPDDEKLGLAQLMAQQPTEMPQEEEYVAEDEFNPDIEEYATGGKIHIKKKNRGKFTALKKRTGHSATWFKEHGTPAQKKMATFALNAKHWNHENGGNLYQDGSFIHPRTANRSLGYNDTFEYFNNGAYDEGYLNWLNNIALQSEDDEAFKYLSDIYKTVYPNRTLTLDKARALGQDKMFGDFHRRYGELYKQYLDSQNPKEPVTRWWIKDAKGNDTLVDPSQIDWNKYKYNPEYDQHGTDEADGPYYDDYYVEAIPAETTTETPKTTTTPDTAATEPIKDNLLRYMPAIGSGLQALAAFNTPADFTYSNALNRLAGMYNPIAPTLLGRERENDLDVNLANNEAMAQQAAMQRANRETSNRWTQNANNLALFNAYSKDNAARNLNWQQAQQADDLAVHKLNYDLGSKDQDTIRAYDLADLENNARRIAMKQASAKAADDATTLTSTNRSQSLTNFLNNLGAMGKENMQFALVNKAIRDGALKGLGNEDLYTPIFNWLGNTKVNG